jgi:hypothetical protein
MGTFDSVRAMKLAVAAVLLVCSCSSTPAPPPRGIGPAPAPAPVVGEAPIPHPAPAGVAAVEDEMGQVFQISQGEPGVPAELGCADGQREGFVDAAASPNIAGCIAEWSGVASLRAAATGAACGDDLAACAVPADACAPGWHMCGGAGAIADVSQLSAAQCQGAGGGRFVAAMSHCETQSGCEYDNAQTGTYECFESGWCSEPVCCGADCLSGSCTGGIWEGETRIALGTDQGCGAMASSRARGVLCCR